MKQILMIITAVFFAGMLFLTAFARDIHNSALPHVTASRVQQVQFPFEYTDENGNTFVGTESKLAVTKEQFEQGVYVLYQEEKNGEMRDYIRHANIEAGREHDGYVEVVSGLIFGDRIVVDSDRLLREGEVVLAD
ncbi:MAG: hypothetical protein ACI4WS_01460 [Oscillospiraceae bacterium]